MGGGESAEVFRPASTQRAEGPFDGDIQRRAIKNAELSSTFTLEGVGRLSLSYSVMESLALLDSWLFGPDSIEVRACSKVCSEPCPATSKEILVRAVSLQLTSTAHRGS